MKKFRLQKMMQKILQNMLQKIRQHTSQENISCSKLKKEKEKQLPAGIERVAQVNGESLSHLTI